MINQFELLAPAGSLTALKAAVQAGANAIYLAGSMFGARASAQNFTENEIDEAVMYCHVRNVKVYVTVNTLIKDYEFKKLYDYIQFLYNADVDAVIVQDLGVLHFIKRHWPDFPIHASTQMTITNQQGVQFALEQGINRIVLARELGTHEIKSIIEETNAEIEVFVHGALCFAYSGQCLMSSMLGGRSGNRGRCAQPCRKKYKLIDKESKKIIETKGDFLLSPKDLMTIEEIHTLLDTGVHSLKIEGRMRKPEYVATVVKNYRDAIDAYLNQKNHTLSEEGHKNISLVFNRGFTKGHVLNKGLKDLMNPLAPGHMGVKVGEVTNVDLSKRRVSVQLSDGIRAGDGIKIKSNQYETGMQVTQMWIKNQKMKESQKNDLVELPLTGKVQRGAFVYKTLDKQLAMDTEDRIRKSELKFPIEVDLKLELNEPMELYVKDCRGNQVRVVSEVCPEKALKVALSEDRVETQLRKLGDEPYYIKDLKINLGPDLAVSVKEINALRREAIEELNLIRCNLNQRVYDESPIKLLKQVHRQEVVACKINAKVQNLDQLKCLKDFDLDTVYINDLNLYDQALQLCESYGFKCIPAPSRIQTSLENKTYKNKIEALRPSEILGSNVGHFHLNSSGTTHVDYFLNTFNKETLTFYKELGVCRVTPSIELSEKELKKLIANTDLEIELLGYGFIPLMITENCPIKGNITNIDGCGGCLGKTYILEDEKAYPFPTQCIGGRLVIYNGTALDMYNRVPNLVKLNPDYIRLDFTMESASQIKTIVSSFIDALEHENITNDPSRKQTYGHYFRGVE